MYADLVVGTMGQSDGTVESFVRVVIAKADLELDCLEEFALLADADDVADGFF